MTTLGDHDRTQEIQLAEHREVGGWKDTVPGGCGVECACGVTYDGFDTLGEAAAHLETHIAKQAALAGAVTQTIPAVTESPSGDVPGSPDLDEPAGDGRIADGLSGPGLLGGAAAAPDAGGLPAPQQTDDRPGEWMTVPPEVLALPNEQVGAWAAGQARLRHELAELRDRIDRELALADGLGGLSAAHYQSLGELPFGDLALDHNEGTAIAKHHVTAGSEHERRAAVDRIAAWLGVPAAVQFGLDALTRSTYVVESAWGPVTYRAWTEIDDPPDTDIVTAALDLVDWEGARREHEADRIPVPAEAGAR